MSRENGIRVLVVCLGNICRSPAGEAALKEAASEAGLDLAVDSAGTGPWHVGQKPDPQIRAAGERAGLHVDGSGRQVTEAAELAEYDVILAMDRSNLHALRQIAPHLSDRMHLYRSFDRDTDGDEAPDPYGRSDAAFDEIISIVRSAARGIVDAVGAGRLP